jgi:hypothetical protein
MRPSHGLTRKGNPGPTMSRRTPAQEEGRSTAGRPRRHKAGRPGARRPKAGRLKQRGLDTARLAAGGRFAGAGLSEEALCGLRTLLLEGSAGRSCSTSFDVSRFAANAKRRIGTKQRCGQVFRHAVATGHATRDPTKGLRGAVVPVVTRHYAAITDPWRVGELLRPRRSACYRSHVEVGSAPPRSSWRDAEGRMERVRL